MLEYLRSNPPGRDEEEYNAARVFKQGIDWIEWARTRQPFALVVDSFDAHEPWDAPLNLIDIYDTPKTAGVEPIQPFPTPAGRPRDLNLSRGLVRRMSHLYAAEVTLVDRWFGRLLERLAGLGLDGNTLVVAISDHGVLLGEYGWVGKRYSEMHQPLCHVPFVIRHPQGKAKGRASSYFASTHDVGPTVLGALGYDRPGWMNGADLSPLLDGKQPPRRRWRTAAYNDHVNVRDGRWLLIADNQGRSQEALRHARPTRASAATSPRGTPTRCAGSGATSSATPATSRCRSSRRPAAAERGVLSRSGCPRPGAPAPGGRGAPGTSRSASAGSAGTRASGS